MAGITALSKGLTSLISKKKGDVYLIPLDSKSDAQIGTGLAFQYFPETISDSKSVNYSQKSAPGSSLPVYQWTNSGPRTISFTAMFSTDVDLAAEGVSPVEIESRIKSAGQSRMNVDIRAALAWLRSFMVPSYGENSAVGVPLTYAPQKVLLCIPNSGIGLAGSMDISNADRIVAVMTQCEISYEAFFPSNLPRFATVSLAFDQVPQYKGMVTFPSGGVSDAQLVGAGYIPYSIHPRKLVK